MVAFRLSTVSFSAVCFRVPKLQSGAHVLRSDCIHSKVEISLKRDSREQSLEPNKSHTQERCHHCPEFTCEMDLEPQDLLRAPHWPPCLREPARLSLSFAEFLGEMLLFLLSCFIVSNSATPWTATCQAPLSFTIYQSLLRFMSIELVILSNHLMLHSA